MSTETANLGLIKPELDEQYQLSVWNNNSDIIDQFAGEVNAALAAESTAREETDDAVARLVNESGKNRVKPTATSQTVNGIEWTVNDDGTITASGEATDNSYITVQVLPADSVFDGSYFLSGCPEGGSGTTHALYVARGSYTKYDYGEGVTLSKSTDGLNKNLTAIVYSGQTVDSLTFRPMICKAAYMQATPEYEPYCPTLQELYAMVQALSSSRSLQASEPPGEEER